MYRGGLSDSLSEDNKIRNKEIWNKDDKRINKQPSNETSKYEIKIIFKKKEVK